MNLQENNSEEFVMSLNPEGDDPKVGIGADGTSGGENGEDPNKE